LAVLAELGDREVLGQDLHLLGMPRRMKMAMASSITLVGDDGVALLDGVAEQRGAGHAGDLRRPRSMRASASSVQEMISSALTSSGG